MARLPLSRAGCGSCKPRNTACASCHSLDRVKNKTADKDGWTTTVTRVKGLGANLTDEQVPVVVEFLTRAAGTLTVAAP
jgi:hypothetical protein